MLDKHWKKYLIKSTITAIQNAHWLVAVLSIFIFFLLISYIQAQEPTETVLNLSRDNLLAVTGSMLASAVFFIIVEIILALKSSVKNAEKTWWEETYQKAGIRNIFLERGNGEARFLYNELISNAEFRIWAIGTNNTRFFDQHSDQISTLLKKKVNIDIRIAMLDPESTVNIPNQTDPIEIKEIQYALENSTSSLSGYPAVCNQVAANCQEG